MAKFDHLDDYMDTLPLPGIDPLPPIRRSAYLRLNRRTVETGRAGVAAARAALHGEREQEDDRRSAAA